MDDLYWRIVDFLQALAAGLLVGGTYGVASRDQRHKRRHADGRADLGGGGTAGTPLIDGPLQTRWVPANDPELRGQLEGRPHLFVVGEGSDEVAAAIDSWLDGVLHAIGFAPASCLGGGFLETPWEDVATALHISTYSLKEVAATLEAIGELDSLLAQRPWRERFASRALAS